MKIVFFGLGTVAGVMATCLYELCERSNTPLKLFFIVRDPKKARSELHKAPKLLNLSKFLQVKNFQQIFKHPKDFPEIFNADVLINSSLPEFNIPILRLAEKLNANYVDFASDMYNKHTLSTLSFAQEAYHKKMVKKKNFGLINIGISPGVTNFLIGEKIFELQTLAPDIEFKSISIYLLEDISSRQIYFSWSPVVALTELEEYPRYFEKGILKKIEPFSISCPMEFPFCNSKIDVYPIFQEEVLSLRQSFPQLKNIKIYTGGGEVELIKNLYQLNLLSKRHIDCIKQDISIEKIIRLALPGMEKPKVIEKAVKDGLISRAQFAAVAEIIFETRTPISRLITTVTEKIGMSFHRFRELIGTPYAGTTYIGYPTGVAAAVLFFYTFKAWENDRKIFSGILRSEELPALLGFSRTAQVKRELSFYKIDFSSTEQTLKHTETENFTALKKMKRKTK